MADVRDSGEETWFAARAGAREPRPSLGFELDVDVCVIGAGLAGLSVARELAIRGWSVAVLEAGRIADAASGRNAGIVAAGYAASPDSIVARVGADHARALWAISERGVDLVRQNVRGLRMRGVELVTGGRLEVSRIADEAMLAARAQMLRDDLGASLDVWPRERLAAALNSPAYRGALYDARAFSLNPLAYAMGLVTAAETAGVRIYENTPAVEIDPAGIRKRIATPGGRVRAQQVILAAGLGLRTLAPRLSETLMPLSMPMMVTEPLGERLASAVATRAAVAENEWPGGGYRIVAGDRLLCWGRASMRPGDPRRSGSALAKGIARTHPQLGRVEVAAAWSGTVGRTLHRMPQIGEFMPGVWLLNGFGEHGLAITAVAGQLVAQAIAEASDEWRAYEPFHLVWPGGRVGRVLISVSGWGRAVRARWRARRAATARPLSPSPDASGDAEVRPVESVESAAPVAAPALAVAELPQLPVEMSPVLQDASPRLGRGRRNSRKNPRAKGDSGAPADGSVNGASAPPPPEPKD